MSALSILIIIKNTFFHSELASVITWLVSLLIEIEAVFIHSFEERFKNQFEFET